MKASDDLDQWSEAQKLRQEGDMDCGVSVFGELAHLSREEFLNDLPAAAHGLSTDQVKDYLERKGFKVRVYGPKEEPPLPCAHLVGTAQHCHWVYQAADGGIHDPSPVFEHCPPKTIHLESHYGSRILSVAITPTMPKN